MSVTNFDITDMKCYTASDFYPEYIKLKTTISKQIVYFKLFKGNNSSKFEKIMSFDGMHVILNDKRMLYNIPWRCTKSGAHEY